MKRTAQSAVPGGTFFFTVALAEAGSRLLVDEVALLRDVVAAVRAEHPMEIDAMVILPDHLHAVWTLPRGDTGAAIRWRKIKASFARHCRAKDEASRAELWRPGVLEHSVADPAEHRRHLARCWHDPVRHGLVARPADWPFSSLHREIRAGRVPADWTADWPADRPVDLTNRSVPRPAA